MNRARILLWITATAALLLSAASIFAQGYSIGPIAGGPFAGRTPFGISRRMPLGGSKFLLVPRNASTPHNYEWISQTIEVPFEVRERIQARLFNASRHTQYTTPPPSAKMRGNMVPARPPKMWFPSEMPDWLQDRDDLLTAGDLLLIEGSTATGSDWPAYGAPLARSKPVGRPGGYGGGGGGIGAPRHSTAVDPRIENPFTEDHETLARRNFQGRGGFRSGVPLNYLAADFGPAGPASPFAYAPQGGPGLTEINVPNAFSWRESRYLRGWSTGILYPEVGGSWVGDDHPDRSVHEEGFVIRGGAAVSAPSRGGPHVRPRQTYARGWGGSTGEPDEITIDKNAGRRVNMMSGGGTISGPAVGVRTRDPHKRTVRFVGDDAIGLDDDDSLEDLLPNLGTLGWGGGFGISQSRGGRTSRTFAAGTSINRYAPTIGGFAGLVAETPGLGLALDRFPLVDLHDGAQLGETMVRSTNSRSRRGFTANVAAPTTIMAGAFEQNWSGQMQVFSRMTGSYPWGSASRQGPIQGGFAFAGGFNNRDRGSFDRRQANLDRETNREEFPNERGVVPSRTPSKSRSRQREDLSPWKFDNVEGYYPTEAGGSFGSGGSKSYIVNVRGEADEGRATTTFANRGQRSGFTGFAGPRSDDRLHATDPIVFDVDRTRRSIDRRPPTGGGPTQEESTYSVRRTRLGEGEDEGGEAARRAQRSENRADYLQRNREGRDAAFNRVESAGTGSTGGARRPASGARIDTFSPQAPDYYPDLSLLGARLDDDDGPLWNDTRPARRGSPAIAGRPTERALERPELQSAATKGIDLDPLDRSRRSRSSTGIQGGDVGGSGSGRTLLDTGASRNSYFQQTGHYYPR